MMIYRSWHTQWRKTYFTSNHLSISTITYTAYWTKHFACSHLYVSLSPVLVTKLTFMIHTQVVTVPKYSQEDTFFTTKNSQGEHITVPVPKGTYIAISIPGLHYNRQCLVLPVFPLVSRGHIHCLITDIGWILAFLSTILERSSHIWSISVPWWLAAGCVPSVQ